MDSKFQQDIAFNHSVLNFLTGAYQGRFAALNIMQQLGFVGLKADAIGRTRTDLEKIRRWVSDLYKHVFLFSTNWSTPETFDAQSAFKLLEDIKPELQQVADTTLQVLGDPTTPEHPDLVKYLIASFGRYAYSRDNYIKGYIEYGKVFAFPDLVRQYLALQNIAARDLETAHAILNAYKAPELVTEVFFQGLFEDCIMLPGVFRTHVHDANILLATYKGGITFELADFFGPEALQWQNHGYNALIAGYWRAYGFSPEEATSWLQSGFEFPAMAFEWKFQGINPMVAVPWAQANIPADIALRWLRSGYGAEQALAMINQGIQDPPEDKKP